MFLKRSIFQRDMFQKQNKFALLSLIVLLFPLSSHAQNVVWIGGAQTTRDSFNFFFEALKELGISSIEYASIDTNPLTANHQREISELRKKFGTIEPEKTLYVGYSVGGKFAARLSLDAIEAGRPPFGLFLIDPSGGQPPLQKNSDRFPELIGLDNEPVARALKTVIIGSELGTAPGPFGVPCVNPTHSSSFFKAIFGSALVFSLPNAGHLDFIELTSIPAVYRWSCKRGATDPQSVKNDTMKHLSDWLRPLVSDRD